MTATDERAIYAKLEAMKDIRCKTIQLEKLKMRLIREVENGDAEEKCLAEYRREMDLLLQEKMSHVEELRQIHADINSMETVMKQAEENRSRSLSIANRIHEEYAPLKIEIDHMRREYLGLNPLPELHEEEGSIITAEYEKTLNAFVALKANKNASIFSRFQTTYYPTVKGTHTIASAASYSRPPTHLTQQSTVVQPTSQLTGNVTGTHHQLSNLPPEATVTSLQTHQNSGFLPPPPPPPPPQSVSSVTVGTLRLTKPSEIGGSGGGGGGGGGGGSGIPTRLQQSPSIGMAHPTFRQQPPPMKSCLSCHQQIHRNAPICPLCKAKSRSRNPKKPKKKDH